jgi:hypothetical protein
LYLYWIEGRECRTADLLVLTFNTRRICVPFSGYRRRNTCIPLIGKAKFNIVIPASGVEKTIMDIATAKMSTPNTNALAPFGTLLERLPLQCARHSFDF